MASRRILWKITSGIPGISILCRSAYFSCSRKMKRASPGTSPKMMLSAQQASQPQLLIKKELEGAVLPTKAGPDEIGYDLTVIAEGKKYGKTMLYETGISVKPPEGYYCKIFPRSSLVKTGYIPSKQRRCHRPHLQGHLEDCPNEGRRGCTGPGYTLQESTARA